MERDERPDRTLLSSGQVCCQCLISSALCAPSEAHGAYLTTGQGPPGPTRSLRAWGSRGRGSALYPLPGGDTSRLSCWVGEDHQPLPCGELLIFCGIGGSWPGCQGGQSLVEPCLLCAYWKSKGVDRFQSTPLYSPPNLGGRSRTRTYGPLIKSKCILYAIR